MFKAALGATLVKNERHYEAFDTAFEVFFALQRPAPGDPNGDEGSSDRVRSKGPADRSPDFGGGGSGGEADLEGIIAALKQALAEQVCPMLRAVARRAVEQLAGNGAGPSRRRHLLPLPDLRQLDVEGLLEGLIEEAKASAGELDRSRGAPSPTRSTRGGSHQLREEIKAEIRRRLVADRGSEAVAKTLRQAAPRGHRPHARHRADLVGTRSRSSTR